MRRTRRSRSMFVAALDTRALEEIEADAARFEACLADAQPRAPGPVEGYFGSDSMVWRMFGELAVNLGGFRAVVMQIALPEVTAAAIDNARFREGFLSRSLESFYTVSEIAFGDLATATAAARRLHVLHAMVRGTIPGEASRRKRGAPYRANDPRLLLWVLATLYEAAVFAHDRLVRPLTDDERARYWAETRLMGLLHGIPLDAMPATVAAFERYWSEMVTGGDLEAGPGAHELGRFVVSSTPGRALLGRSRTPLAWLDDVLLAGTVPAEWTERLGIRVTARQRSVFRALCVASRAGLRAVPVPLRRTPAYHQALLRLARARGRRPAVSAVAIERLNARVRLPLSLKPVRALEGDSRTVLEDLLG